MNQETHSIENHTHLPRGSMQGSQSFPPFDALVYIVDDDPSVRQGLVRLLKSADRPVRTFDSPEAFLARPAHPGPACLVLDLRMPGLDGFQLQQQLAQGGTRLPIVFLTGHGDIPSSVRAMKAGAVDFLTKPVDGTVLLAAIDQALERSRDDQRRQAETRQLQAALDNLTPREHQVLCQVVLGRLNKQIAADLDICEKTVKVHRAQVMKKMQVRTLAELVKATERLDLNSYRHATRQVDTTRSA